MGLPRVGKLRFVSPKNPARGNQTSLTPNVVVRLRNQVTTGRTVKLITVIR